MPDLGYAIYDADNHYYEPDDCYSRHIEARYRDRTMRITTSSWRVTNCSSSRCRKAARASKCRAAHPRNDSEYGLNGTIWTRDRDRGFRLAERLETGGVCVNEMTITYGVTEAPFGGRKASGVGQVNGPEGLRAWCHAKPITADRRGRGAIQGGYPYSAKGTAGMQKFIRLLWGTRLGRWLS